VYVLDTDHVTLLERGQGAECDRVRSHLASLKDRDVAVSIVTFEEQTRGWLAYLARARSLAQQVEAYRRLRRMVDNYRSVPLIDFDPAAATEFQRLRSLRLRIGTMDLKIAAIARAHGAILVTRNRVDFEKIPGLTLEDWTV
jgi:tRNA(fMet)-specific endonuclease VapC